MPRRRMFLAAATVLLGLAACGSDDDGGAASATTLAAVTTPVPAPTTDSSNTESSVPSDSTDTTGAVDTAPSSGPEIEPSAVGAVELVDPGAEPRDALRLRLEAGSTSTFVMTVGLSFSMTFDGEPLPSTEIPAMAMTIESVIDAVDADGTASYTFTFTQIEAVEGSADPETIEAVQEGLEQLKGLSGQATVDDRGKTLAAEMDTSAVDDPALRAQMDQFAGQLESLTVPFPEEPVGVGAEWVATNRALLNGVTTIVETEYRLVSSTADGYELEVVQNQSAEPGPIELPGLPAGSDTEMRETDIRGGGTIFGRLDRIIGTSDLHSEGSILLFLDLGSQSGDVVQEIEVDVVVEHS